MLRWICERNEHVTEIELREVVYLTQNDEAAFFGWIDKISSVDEYYGEVSSLFLKVTSCSDEDLYELIALFDRYLVGKAELAKLRTEQNQGWFHDSDAWWFDDVFGSLDSDAR